jgi:hypothetical protein
MGKVPTTSNEAASIGDDIITAANSVGVKVIQAMIVAEVPFFGLPVVSTLLGYLLGWLDGYISKAEQAGATFIIIDIQTSLEEKGVIDAVRLIAAAQAAGDPVALKNAISAYQLAQSNLVHSDGSATPS